MKYMEKSKIKQQWGFYFNQDRCLGCKTCVVACKQWNEEHRGDTDLNKNDYSLANQIDPKYVANEGKLEKSANFIDPKTGETNYPEYRKYYMKEMWRKVNVEESGKTGMDEETGVFNSDYERTFVSVSCNHCDKPACIEVCPVGRIFKDKDTGAVLTNKAIDCISCGSCKEACPWDAPQFYTDEFTESKAIMTKCTLCSDRTTKGLKPACVAACWNRALDAGPVSELKKKYRKNVQTVQGFDRADTEPNIIFNAKTNFNK